MKPRIIFNPISRRPGIAKRPTFTPFAQDAPQQQPIGKQILDYLRFGKPIAAPVTPIKTEVLIPTETKRFARTMIFTLVGGIVAGVILYKVL